MRERHNIVSSQPHHCERTFAPHSLNRPMIRVWANSLTQLGISLARLIDIHRDYCPNDYEPAVANNVIEIGLNSIGFLATERLGIFDFIAKLKKLPPKPLAVRGLKVINAVFVKPLPPAFTEAPPAFCISNDRRRDHNPLPMTIGAVINSRCVNHHKPPAMARSNLALRQPPSAVRGALSATNTHSCSRTHCTGSSFHSSS